MHPLLPPTPSLPTPGPRSSSRRDPGCASQPPRPGDGEPTTRTAWHPDGLCGEEEEEAGRQEEGFPPHVLDPRRRQPRSGGRLLLYGRCSAGGGGVRGRSLNPPSSSKIASSKPDGRQIAAPTPWRSGAQERPLRRLPPSSSGGGRFFLHSGIGGQAHKRPLRPSGGRFFNHSGISDSGHAPSPEARPCWLSICINSDIF